jgi:hypothetical protein
MPCRASGDSTYISCNARKLRYVAETVRRFRLFCLLGHVLCNSVHNISCVLLRNNYTKNGMSDFELLVNEYS